MGGYRDPFNRRPLPWGREDPDFLNHFRRLSQLRKDFEAFRLGDIHFFEAGDRHIGFTRSYKGRTFRVYCNRSADPWEIPGGKLHFGEYMRLVSKEQLIIGARGFCVTEDV